MHGSVTMRDVSGVAAERRMEAEAAAAAKEEKARAKAEAKAAEEAEAARLVAAFELCEHSCACGVMPCPMAKWKRCPVCGPKSSLCKVRTCVAARKPLLLDYNPAVAEPRRCRWWRGLFYEPRVPQCPLHGSHVSVIQTFY